MNQLSQRLQIEIDKYYPILLELSEELVSKKPNPQKWSRKELLGHLIDSAANNHQRFVRIQDKEDLVFDGYDQDNWVINQHYQDRKWKDIVALWYHYNCHLAFVIGEMSMDIINKSRTTHNLHQIAFRTIPKEESTTLFYFINDYIDHLEYHLNHIFVYPYK